MNLFQSVLQKISDSIQATEGDKETISAVFVDVLGVTIVPDMLRYRERRVYIQTSPTVKLAIKLKEKELIQKLKEKNISVTAIV